MKTKFFASSRGHHPVEEYLAALETRERATVRAKLGYIDEHGLQDPLVATRQLQGKLWELKIKSHRLLYAVFDDTIFLLHAFKKQAWKAPRGEIETALARLAKLVAEEEQDDASTQKSGSATGARRRRRR